MGQVGSHEKNPGPAGWIQSCRPAALPTPGSISPKRDLRGLEKHGREGEWRLAGDDPKAKGFTRWRCAAETPVFEHQVT